VQPVVDAAGVEFTYLSTACSHVCAWLLNGSSLLLLLACHGADMYHWLSSSGMKLMIRSVLLGLFCVAIKRVLLAECKVSLMVDFG
jgi:hypothetical protein